MRITFVLPSGGGGGGARVIVRFAVGLRERGHDVQILFPHQHKDLREWMRELYLGLRYQHRHDWLRTYPGIGRAYRALTPDIVGNNDALVAVGVDSVLATADLPESSGVKIHNSHGMEPWIADRMRQAWQLPMPRIVSASYLVQAMRQCGSNDPIFVVHNGVDRARYFASRPEHLRRGVGTVYHGASPKDPRAILATLQSIREAHPEVPLYVFGTHPRPRGLHADRYVRLPTVEVARDLYSLSQVWFCASRNEGFGLPLLEAMACGCAVVSTDCGGPSDIIEQGTTGWLVPVGDTDAVGQPNPVHPAELSPARGSRRRWPGETGALRLAARNTAVRARVAVDRCVHRHWGEDTGPGPSRRQREDAAMNMNRMFQAVWRKGQILSAPDSSGVGDFTPSALGR